MCQLSHMMPCIHQPHDALHSLIIYIYISKGLAGVSAQPHDALHSLIIYIYISKGLAGVSAQLTHMPCIH